MTEEEAKEIAKDMDACLTHLVRQWTYDVTGSNCTFADDDVKILACLAKWALENGVPDDLAPNIIPRAKKHLQATQPAT